MYEFLNTPVSIGGLIGWVFFWCALSGILQMMTDAANKK